MRVVSFDRLALPQTAFVSLLNVTALICLAAVLAHWTWRWMLPPPEPSVDVVLASSPGGGQGFDLFGRPVASAVATAVGIRLLGVVAAADGFPGYAVLQVDGQRIVAARVGSEVAPGLRLAEVHARQVVLERSGIRERLVLPRPLPPTASRPTP